MTQGIIDRLQILIVDDDSQKRERVTAIVNQVLDGAANITCASCVAEAMAECRKVQFDLLILDIVLPQVSGSPVQAEAGTRFLSRLRIDANLHYPTHIICITQHAEILTKRESELSAQDISLLDMRDGIAEWTRPLASRLEDLLVVKSRKSTTSVSGYTKDFAIVTSMYDPELREVIREFAEVDQNVERGDPYIFRETKLSTSSGVLHGVVVASDEPGNTAIATLITSLCCKYSPRIVVLCGIAAGRNEYVQLGDVVIAEHCWNYSDGKTMAVSGESAEFHGEVRQVAITPELASLAKAFHNRRILVNEIGAANPDETRLDVNVVYGPWVCVPSVIADSSAWERAVFINRKVIALDMECYGAYYSASRAARPRPSVIAIKGVVDYADGEKGESWHTFASRASALVAKRFLCALPAN